MKNFIQIFILSILLQTFNTLINAQNTYVPDDNFEQTLIDLGYDTGALDDYVPTANIMAVTNLNLYEKDISDLTGIEDFSSLEELNFTNNNVSTVELSTLTLLKELESGNNNLATLDLSANAALEKLWCGYNQLTSLDLQNNPNLNYLACNNNQLTQLDLQNNTQLESIFCQNNQLATLDLQYNILLYELGSDGNPFTTLDFSNNPEIQKVFCSHTEISSFIFPDNCKIYRLSCESANLTEIDLSMLEDLDFISVWNNDITVLDVSNNLLLTELLCGSNLIESLIIPESNIINKIDCRDNQLGNLAELLNVDSGGNTIKEQNPALVTLNIRQNNFVFADLESRWVELSQITAFSYDEQNRIGAQADVSIEQGTEFTLEIEGYVPAASDQYQWYKDLEILNGETGLVLELESIDFDDEGYYHCIVTNTQVPDLTLQSYDVHVIVTMVGVEDFENTTINIYPNPAADFINIESEDYNAQIQLYNLKGKKMMEYYSLSNGKIDVTDIPKGMYILTISTPSENVAKKVLIE